MKFPQPSGTGDFSCRINRVLHRNRLDSVILFVTGECNLNCAFCCYPKERKQKTDLLLEHFQSISRSLPPFRNLSLSGGEPFLRPDLAEIMLLFSRNNQIASLYVPTNGWFQPKVVEACQKFLGCERNVLLNLSLSIDGPAEAHDRLRGRKGAFEKAEGTLRAALTLRRQFPNMRVLVNSVVGPENSDSLHALIDHFFEKYDLDEHALEIVRPTDHLHNLEQYDNEANRSLAKQFLDLSDYACALYSERSAKRMMRFSHWPVPIARFVVYAFNRVAAQIKYDRYHGRRWPFPCTAGRNIIVIDSGGGLRLCEHDPQSLDLKDFGFDVEKVLESEQFLEGYRKMPFGRCDCVHGCFVGNSLQYAPWVMVLKGLPLLMQYCQQKCFLKKNHPN